MAKTPFEFFTNITERHQHNKSKPKSNQVCVYIEQDDDNDSWSRLKCTNRVLSSYLSTYLGSNQIFLLQYEIKLEIKNLYFITKILWFLSLQFTRISWRYNRISITLS